MPSDFPPLTDQQRDELAYFGFEDVARNYEALRTAHERLLTVYQRLWTYARTRDFERMQPFIEESETHA